MTRALRLALVLVTVWMPWLASAQTPKLELGASLANAVIGVGENDSGTIFGIPSGGFGLTNPGVYASFFVAPRLAIEPQLGLVVASFDGDTTHIVNVAGQVNVFFSDVARPAAYGFGSAGIVDVSDAFVNPKSLSAGLGYRVPVGENLSLRFDGRYTRYIFEDEGSNTIGFTLSIGGLFGRG